MGLWPLSSGTFFGKIINYFLVAGALGCVATLWGCSASTSSNHTSMSTGSPVLAGAIPAGPVKWNPGHYMGSNGILTSNRTMADFKTEMDAINAWDNVIGYRVFVSWGALESAQGVYNFAVLDAILSRLQTQYNKPKRLVIALLPGSFGGSGLHEDDDRYIPLYIQHNASYGPSPTSGSFGWWGPSAAGVSKSSYAAAIWRPAVTDRLIALVQALGAHYDSQPNFEALIFQEDSWIAANANTSPGAPDYSDSAMVTQLERLLTAATAAFPHTSVAMENTWLKYPTPAQSFEQWMVANRIAPASPDTVGQSAFTNFNYANRALAPGLQALLGIRNNGSAATPTDMRPQARAMMDIEAPDIAGADYAAEGAAAGFQPLDLIAALNKTYLASHAFWTHLFGAERIVGGKTVGEVSPWAVWSNLAPVINANPLTNTAYPGNYPRP
jgi:hypothetical protein